VHEIKRAATANSLVKHSGLNGVHQSDTHRMPPFQTNQTFRGQPQVLLL